MDTIHLIWSFMDNEKIIEKIHDARLRMGFSQEKIAKEIGVNRATYIAIESGRRPLNLNEISIICKILQIPFAELLVNREETEYNSEKFKQLYFYILKNGLKGNNVTKTKLAKLFYLIDFTYYYLYGKSITGASYYKNHYGPLAKNFLSITDEFFDKGLINIKVFDLAQLISLSDFNNEINFEIFSDKEKEIVDMVCGYWAEKRTKEIVNFTHSQMPWKERADGEYIPYNSIKEESINNIYAPTDAVIKNLFEKSVGSHV